MLRDKSVSMLTLCAVLLGSGCTTSNNTLLSRLPFTEGSSAESSKVVEPIQEESPSTVSPVGWFQPVQSQQQPKSSSFFGGIKQSVGNYVPSLPHYGSSAQANPALTSQTFAQQVQQQLAVQNQSRLPVAQKRNMFGFQQPSPTPQSPAIQPVYMARNPAQNLAVQQAVPSKSSPFTSMKKWFNNATGKVTTPQPQVNLPINQTPVIQKNVSAFSPNPKTQLAVGSVVTEDLQLTLASKAEAAGNISLAKNYYEQILLKKPNSTKTLTAFGNLEDRQGHLEEAEKLYSRALQITPLDASLYNTLGLCLARQKKLEPSASILQQAVKLQPQTELFRNNLATVLINLNRDREAYEQLSALRDDSVAYYNQAFLMNQSGRTADAINHLKAALKVNPQFAEAQQMLQQIESTQTTSTATTAPVATIPATAPASTANGATVNAPATAGSPQNFLPSTPVNRGTPAVPAAVAPMQQQPPVMVPTGPTLNFPQARQNQYRGLNPTQYQHALQQRQAPQYQASRYQTPQRPASRYQQVPSQQVPSQQVQVPSGRYSPIQTAVRPQIIPNGRQPAANNTLKYLPTVKLRK